jgi:sigma-B regulation protein RsbU (phosphoserine phosphatase)
LNSAETYPDSSLNDVPCGYAAFNDAGILLSVNATLCGYLGYTAQELNGQKFEFILNIAGRIFFQTHLFPMLKMQDRAEEIFLSLSAKNSEMVPVVVNAVRRKNNGDVLNTCVFIPVRNRRQYEDELLAAKKQAEDMLHENKALLLARKESSRHALELDKQLVKLNAMNKELLQFNNIINHDMQECVRKILIFSSLEKSEPEAGYLGRITESAQRLKTINESLNIFINLGTGLRELRSIDLNQCVQKAKEDVVKRTGFSELSIESDLLPVIDGAFNELKILFYNLLHNAVKFRKQEDVRVKITAVTFESNVYRNTSDKYDYREMVRITMTDNSKGFDNQYGESVFNLLDKQHRISGAVGAGLAICKKIVDNYNGEIKIQTSEGNGASVTLTLPLQQF